MAHCFSNSKRKWILHRTRIKYCSVL